MRRTPSPKRAFTLIELLTVIAIIAVLAALISPVVGRMKERANEATCISNLRQIGIALVAYAADNNQQLPPQYWWSNGAAPPALLKGDGPNGLGYLVTGGYLGLAVEIPVGSKKTKVLRCPSKPSAAFFDLTANWCSYVYQNPGNMIVLKPTWALAIDAAQTFDGNPVPHAGDLTNVLYGDMHVEPRPSIIGNTEVAGVVPSKFDLTDKPRP